MAAACSLALLSLTFRAISSTSASGLSKNPPAPQGRSPPCQRASATPPGGEDGGLRATHRISPGPLRRSDRLHQRVAGVCFPFLFFDVFSDVHAYYNRHNSRALRRENEPFRHYICSSTMKSAKVGRKCSENRAKMTPKTAQISPFHPEIALKKNLKIPIRCGSWARLQGLFIVAGCPMQFCKAKVECVPRGGLRRPRSLRRLDAKRVPGRLLYKPA